MADSNSIRSATAADAAAIAEIYNHYITETVVTFEVEPLTVAEMSRRIEEIQSCSYPWLVAERGGSVMGYAYASQWHVRRAYRYSAEMTVYLAPGQQRRGVGTALYQQVIDKLTLDGFHTVIGGIALPNEASVALHEKFGFRMAAHYREVGFKFGRWIDVGYWQRFL